MNELDRESLRATIRQWSPTERSIALERALEILPCDTLERWLAGLVDLDRHRPPAPAKSPSLSERIAAHAAATRQGAFLGELVIRNRHGQHEPAETHAWVAATAHLFDLA